MSNNRTEQQSLVDGLTPTVDLDELQPAMVQDGYVFKKDISSVRTITGGGSEILSYATIDQFEVVIDGAGTATITIQDLEMGQEGKLIIRKAIASTPIVFQGVSNSSIGETRRTGVFLYNVVNIGGEILISEIGVGRSGNVSSSDYTVTNATLIETTYFYYKVVGKVCKIWGRIALDVPNGQNMNLLFAPYFFGTLRDNESYHGTCDYIILNSSNIRIYQSTSSMVVYEDTSNQILQIKPSESDSTPLPEQAKSAVKFYIEIPVI